MIGIRHVCTVCTQLKKRNLIPRCENMGAVCRVFTIFFFYKWLIELTLTLKVG